MPDPKSDEISPDTRREQILNIAKLMDELRFDAVARLEFTAATFWRDERARVMEQLDKLTQEPGGST